MPEETAQAATTQAAQTQQQTQAQAATTQTETAAHQQATTQAAEPKVFDEEYVKTLRSEAAKYRTDLKKYQDAEEARKAAEMTETEKLKAEADKAKATATQAQERIIRSEVKLAAAKAGIVDPDAAYALMDRAKIETGEDGEPTNLEALIADLAKAKPYLVGQAPQAPAPGAATNPSRQGAAAGAPVYTTTQLQDRAFYAANRDAIMKAMSEGRIVQG